VRLPLTLVRQVVEHSSQPDLALAAVSFCIAACFVIGLRDVLGF
jgi:hypothetical protein